MKTIIHVNQHNIKSNTIKGTTLPVLTIKDYKQNRKANMISCDGPFKIIYSPDKPLKCGAKVWIETEAEVRID